MAIARTLPQLINSVRRRAFMKAEDPDFTDSDITEVLNEQVGSYLCELIRPYLQGYGLQTFDQLLVTGQQDYLLPERALAGTIEAMGIVDPTGVVPGYRLVTYDPQDAVLLQKSGGALVPLAYELHSNAVRLFPAPSPAGVPTNTLRIQAFQRPSQLVDPSAVASISGALTNVTSTSYRVPITGTAPTTFTAGQVVEIVSATAGYSTYAPTGVISATGGGFVDVTGTAPIAPYTPKAGDYLCLYDQAPVVTNIPLEFQECLLQWTAVKLLEFKGDSSGMDRAGKVLQVSEKNLTHQLPKRNRGADRFLSAWAGLRGVPVRGLLWPISNSNAGP